MPTTTNLSITTPTVGGSSDAWGTILNSAFDTIDAVFAAAGTGVSMNIDGGTIDNITRLSIGTTTATTGEIRMPNNGAIDFRNQANTANITAITLTSGNSLHIGVDAQLASGDIVIGATGVSVGFGDAITGPFNHDGSTFGALGKAPASQYANINVPTLTTGTWADQDSVVETILGQITACLQQFGFSATS